MKHLVLDIEHYRRLNKLSKRDLCAKAGISQSTYWRCVTGKADITVKAAQSLANALNMQLTLSAKTRD